jgi:PKD repeat protein
VVANLAPTASFTSRCSGLTCTFTNGSSDSDGSIVGRSWNFGDGATSTSNNPSRTYAAAGTYTVRLTVTDDDGATGTTTASVTVTAPNRAPTALFGSACIKLSCTFTDRSTDPDGNNTIVAWSWTFGDGTSSTLRNPTHVYGGKGAFKVKLTVTDNRGASDPVTHTVTVAP